MDYNSLTSNKKCKNGEGKNVSNIGICDLPDPILQIIISYLPTKEAVQTSVLSKRWACLWKGISRIELREGPPEKRQQFIDSVRKLLVVCDCSNLEKFCLSCEVGDDASHINEWLREFINPKIQELDLDLEGVMERIVFPDHLFTCPTLTKFQLSMLHIFFFPSSVCFKSLRTLTLDHITFPDCSLTQQLFSGCPLLEELSLINCDWVNVKNVCISSPVLQKLFIIDQRENDHDESDEDDDIGGPHVFGSCEVVIIGTNLKSFSYNGLTKNDFVLYESTSVTNASIKVHIPEYWWHVVDWNRDSAFSVFRLLKELSNVEKLTISEIALLVIDGISYLLGHLPLFHNLAEVHVVATDAPISLYCKPLLTILRNSPCLRVVHFDMGGVALDEDCVNDNYTLDPLPVCFKTHLKTIKICWFSGSEIELNAIKFLLQEASVLDTLYICCRSFDFHSPMESKRLKKLYNRIVRFPKASMDCKITLECL